jgi:hypothetical protein
MRLRVAPHPASSGSAGDRVSGCPGSRVLQRFLGRIAGCPALHSFGCASRCFHQVAPASASSGCAGDRSSSRPESRILQRLRCACRGFPPRPRLSSYACRCFPPGCPGFRIFRLCRRPIRELPRSSYPSAPLALLPWVAPRLRASSCASRWVCRLPRIPHLPALPWVRSFGLPLCFVPLAPADGFPSCLGSRTLRLCRPCVFRFP